MRTYIYYCVLLIFSLLISGCRKKASISPVLQEAESLLPTDPDSAYRLLEALPSPEKSRNLEYATWCLLFTQAKDKSYRTHTSDSLIRFATDYFRTSGDRKRYATALYTSGRVASELDEPDDAVRFYIEAEEVGREVGDYYLLHLITSQLGTVYAYRDFVDKASDTYRRSLEYAEQSGDKTDISEACCFLGRIYSLQENWTKADSCYTKAIQVAREAGNPFFLSKVLCESASIMVRMGDFERAEVCYKVVDTLVQVDKWRGKYQYYVGKGNLFRLQKKYLLAIPYLEKSLFSDNPYKRRSACKRLYLTYREKGDYAKAFEYVETYWAIQDSIKANEHLEAIAKVEAKYNQEKLKRHNQELVWKSRLLSCVILLALLSLWLLFLYGRRYYRKIIRQKEARLAGLSEQVRKLEKQKESNLQQIACKEDELKKLSELLDTSRIHQSDWNIQKEELQVSINSYKQANRKLEEQLEQLRKKLSGRQVTSREIAVSSPGSICWKDTVYARLQNAPYCLKDEDWAELCGFTDLVHHHFLSRLKKEFPSLTENDIHYCCLFRWAFPNSTIATIMNVSPTSVSQWKQRFKKKVNQSEIDTFIREY